ELAARSWGQPRAGPTFSKSSQPNVRSRARKRSWSAAFAFAGSHLFCAIPQEALLRSPHRGGQARASQIRRSTDPEACATLCRDDVFVGWTPRDLLTRRYFFFSVRGQIH